MTGGLLVISAITTTGIVINSLTSCILCAELPVDRRPWKAGVGRLADRAYCFDLAAGPVVV